MPELVPSPLESRLYPLPEQANELDRLAATGEFISNTFEGVNISDDELAEARGVLADACHSELGTAVEDRLRTVNAASVWHHSNEVGLLTDVALQRMGVSRRARRIAARAALGHDVGKEDNEVREAINTDGPLTERARRTMEKHSQFSAIFAHDHGASDEEVTAILLHHVFVKVNNDKHQRPYPENVTMLGDGLGEIAARVLANDPEIMLVVATLAYADSISACATGGNLRSYHRPAENFAAALRMTTEEAIDIPNRQLGAPVEWTIYTLADAA